MNRWWLLVALLTGGSFAAAAVGHAQKPAATPANPENIEAALKLTLAAAAEYEMRVGKDHNEKPLELLREPVLKWSNPELGEIHGNVFLWTREGRPQVVGSFFKWFSPQKHMVHEFHSFADEELVAKFHSAPVWKTNEAGLRFANIPSAPAPAAGEAQRFLQIRQLAKEFTGFEKLRNLPSEIELRLLPQPIYRYAAPKQGIINGALFTFVRGTDPEIFLLIEARGKDAASARWQYAGARMNSMAVQWLNHQEKKVWEAETFAWSDIFEKHELVYTNFRFNEIPDFLKNAVDKPKP